MTIYVEEAFESRLGSVGEQANAELVYYTFADAGETETQCELAAVQGSPNNWRSMPRRTSSIKKRLANGVYEIGINYSLEQNQTTPAESDGGGNVTAFNTTLAFNLIGGTQHITTALATTSYVKGGDTVVDVRRTIGIDLKTGQVRGVDVFTPTMDFSFTAQFPNDVVTDAYVDDLYTLTGRTNDAAFKRREAGELLFKGARGSKRGQERWEIAFEFAWSPNETSISIGGLITVPSKKGWQYLDVLYKDGTDKIGGKPVQIPAQVNVHTVFKEGSFSKLKLGTT